MESKPSYNYTPPPAKQRETIVQLNQIAKRALYQNADMGSEALRRAVIAVEKHSGEVLQKDSE